MKKKILLTGVNGFIGNIIYKNFNLNKYDVYCIVRNKKKIFENSIFQDLKNKIKINHKIKFHSIIHCAALSSSNFKKESDFIDYYNNNIIATKNIIDYANKNKIEKIIFLSSISIYGSINTKKLSITNEIQSPNKYGLSKLICEKLLQDKKNYFKSLSIRLPGVIGKFSERNLLSKLLEDIKLSKKIKIYNSKSLFNNCIHVEELAKFIYCLIEKKFYEHDVVLLSSSNPIKFETIINKFIKKFKSKSKINIVKNNKNSFIIENNYANQKYKYKPISTINTINKFIINNL